MANSADAHVRAAWPREWLPPGEVAGRDVGACQVTYASCLATDNWWWGPGRGGDEEARVWFRRHDNMWEEMFVVRPSIVREAGMGLWSARRFYSGHKLLYYTGTVLGKVGDPAALRAVDEARRFSKGGRYIMRVGGTYVDGFRERDGNPAYLMNDLGARLNNVHADSTGAVYVGRSASRGCNIDAGVELCWAYGEEYWSHWPIKRRVGGPEHGVNDNRRKRRLATGDGGRDGSAKRPRATGTHTTREQRARARDVMRGVCEARAEPDDEGMGTPPGRPVRGVTQTMGGGAVSGDEARSDTDDDEEWVCEGGGDDDEDAGMRDGVNGVAPPSRGGGWREQARRVRRETRRAGAPYVRRRRGDGTQPHDGVT